MTELEAARLISEGKLPSPHKFSNMTLFAVRVTGTGGAFRDSLDEYVWRDPSLYLNDEFLARVAGLPLIWEHPKEGSLNSKEFGKRIIGTCMFGYIDGDEVWSVARVYDDEAIKLMTEGQLSTSPGVVFGPADGNVSGTTSEGETLLIEGRPSTLCHLAVCAQGVWDKGQDPTGIQNDTLPSTEQGVVGMAEHEEKVDADKSRHDASEKLDAIMDMVRKMDGEFRKMDARLDAAEKEKNDEAEKRKDAARKDAKKRRDSERDDWAKADAEGCAKDDADEMAECDAMKKDGMDEDEAAEKARDSRKDRMSKRKDSEKKDAKKDSEEEEKKEEKKEEKEEEKSDARKDSAMVRENQELKDRLAALEAAMKGVKTEVSGSDRDALASAQARADSVLAMLGDRAPAPLPGDQPLPYRKRLLKRFAPHSPQFKDTRFDSLDEASLTVIEDRVYADAANSARSVGSTAPGVLIPIEERWRDGRTVTKYVGDPLAFLAPFVSPGQSGNFNPKLIGV